MADTERTEFHPGEGLPGRVYATGKAQWIEDVTRDDNFPRANSLSAVSVRGAFAFPVQIRDEVVAVLEFFSSEIQAPNQSVLDMAEEAGKQLGYVIERKRIERAMEESERKFRGIFDYSSQLMGLVTTDGTIIQFNEAALSMIGKVQEDVLGQRLWESPWWRHSKREALEVKAALEKAVSGKSVRFETTHMDKEGRVRDIDFVLPPITDHDDRVIYLIPEGRDITDRKDAEEALRQFKGTLDQTHDAVFIFDPDTFAFTYVNQGALLQLGYSREELLSITPLNIFCQHLWPCSGTDQGTS
ncbi:PAS domain S-box protein [uncultured Desulfobacter sp.]|uniref:PAS domain S-box protein n=1 Tax=uncultured Desulfobacter sp. TaxID=240139 RepID=UPI0029F46D9A|nr:PAS domain S-box protein [uncultured Desulfobacter sp.]